MAWGGSCDEWWWRLEGVGILFRSAGQRFARPQLLTADRKRVPTPLRLIQLKIRLRQQQMANCPNAVVLLVFLGPVARITHLASTRQIIEQARSGVGGQIVLKEQLDEEI